MLEALSRYKTRSLKKELAARRRITFLRFRPLYCGAYDLQIEVAWDRGQRGHWIFSPMLEQWRPRDRPVSIGEIRAAVERARRHARTAAREAKMIDAERRPRRRADAPADPPERQITFLRFEPFYWDRGPKGHWNFNSRWRYQWVPVAVMISDRTRTLETMMEMRLKVMEARLGAMEGRLRVMEALIGKILDCLSSVQRPDLRAEVRLKELNVRELKERRLAEKQRAKLLAERLDNEDKDFPV